jgi:P-type Ca2+ transporter type 2C
MATFYNQDSDQVLQQFQVDPEQGLSTAEVKKRQEQHGKNVLPREAGTSILGLLLNQFTDLMVVILIIAAVISAFIGEGRDMVVILIIVVINAAIGFYQEYSAEKAIEALSVMQIVRTRIRRNGVIVEVNAEELVPGDIVLLEEGASVPADGRVIATNNLNVEEAPLTGESNPVSKTPATLKEAKVPLGDQTNMAFMGTAITSGRGEMVVTTTGEATEIGHIATLLNKVEDTQTPLQKRLERLGQVLAVGALGVVMIVFIGGLLRGLRADDMFLTAVSLAVAAVPEGLPALVTISLSLGANRMVRRNALIRRLPAVETLGSVTTICTDKTGTLTRNEMTATMLALPYHPDVAITGVGYNSEGQFHNQETNEPINPHADLTLARVVQSFALSTNAVISSDEESDEISDVIGDTTEVALLVAARKVGWRRDELENALPRVGEIPLTSERKAMTTIHRVENVGTDPLYPNARFVSITKGAPDRLISWAESEYSNEQAIPLSEERAARWHEKIDEMASSGLRVLGIGYRGFESKPDTMADEEVERGITLLGLVGILDPARPEAKEAIRVARNAGIRTIMITGDHVLTAEAIARDLGIIDETQTAVPGADIDEISDEALAKKLKTSSVFARVAPEHKLRIVQALQNTGEVAAMTGDGVNDAPALKQADIGVAMGITGTDVSKGAADMVLIDDNFTSIVSAVEEGRVVYDNIRKFLRYILSSNVGEILVMFTAILAGLSVPMLAIHILWVNLLTDGLPALALGWERGESDVMNRSPRDPNEGILAQGTGVHIAFIGTLIAVLTLAGFMYAHYANDLNPFSPTLGMETLSGERLTALAGDAFTIADWDALSVEERREAVLSESATADDGGHEGGGAGLLNAVERMPRTIAFSVLALAQIFQVMGIHPGDHQSFFRVWFRNNTLLMWACILTVMLQLAVIYVPFLQPWMDTVALRPVELGVVFGLAVIALFAVEFKKLFTQGAGA